MNIKNYKNMKFELVLVMGGILTSLMASILFYFSIIDYIQADNGFLVFISIGGEIYALYLLKYFIKKFKTLVTIG